MNWQRGRKMTVEIDLIDKTGRLAEDAAETVEKLIRFAADYENIKEDCEVSITITDNEEIRKLNRDYRGKDQPTDVLSFALEESGDGESEILDADMPRVLGDIIISLDKAREQAEEYGHSFMRELGFLAVHGFLHLLGYDHGTEEEEKIMFRKQDEILEQFGLPR